MDARALLLVTVALLTVYTVGIGGSTAAAIGTRDAFRRRTRTTTNLDPRAGEVVLSAPALPRFARALRLVGWIAFPLALVLALFADRGYQWLAPLTVILMVGLNAFYFTAMQGMGEQLTLTIDGFRVGRKPGVRWLHVTDLMGAHVSSFRSMKMSEVGEWQDPKAVPNVIFYRLNRALVRPNKTVLQRLSGLNYYDGIIRNVFGVSTEQLLQAMRASQRQALDAEAPPFRRPRPGEVAPVKNPEL
ncbi:MAG: hypothetical protein ABI401_02560 [Candidatus Dormibacter sp.]